MRETEIEREREIVVNMDHMSMLEFGQFFIFIFNLPVFPFSLPFVSSLIIASNTLPHWTGPDGSETDKTDMGNSPTLLSGTFFKVGT